MGRVSGLNSPLLLGFENLERLLDHLSKASADGYPPYNIEQIGTDGLRITLAVAGFGVDDLTVTVENSQLLLRGRKREDDASRVFLYRGIASRQFQRTFVLASGIEVTGATLDNGLLHVDLHRLAPEPDVRTIRIDRGRGQPRRDAPVAGEVATGGDDGAARTVTLSTPDA
jgi:HSP20 family molecular chaperone IbpA